MIAQNIDQQQYIEADLEILERFAVRASTALQTARLMNWEQRMFVQLTTLHEIGDYIQIAQDLDKILHVVLTGITAGYGLGFNRAAVFLLDERRDLKGQVGIGHLEKQEALDDWKQHHQQGMENFRRYLQRLEKDNPTRTPIGDGIKEQRLPLGLPSSDVFSQVMQEKHWTLVTQDDELNKLPSIFRETFRPGLPLVVIPLVAEDQGIGILVADNKFTQSPIEDVEPLLTLANAAAVAVQNILSNATQLPPSSTGLRESLKQIVRGAREVLQADSAAIWFYDEARDTFIPENSVATGIPDKLWEEFRRQEPRQSGTAYEVMQKGWIGVQNISQEQRLESLRDPTRELLGQIGVQSFQGLALPVGSENLGVLYVNYNQPRSLNEEEQETAQAFANLAALALKKAKLLDQVSKAKRAAEVVARVTTLGDHDVSLLSVAQGTWEAVGCDAVTLYAYDPTTKELAYPPKMAGVHYEDRVKRFAGVASGSIVDIILQQDKPYIVERIIEDNLFKGTRFAQDEGIQSCVAIPLQVAKQKVGVMFVNYRTPHRFTAAELNAIDLFANQAAVAIHNAQLYKQWKQTDKLVIARTAVAWMGMNSSQGRHGINNDATTIQDLVRHLHSDLDTGATIECLKERLSKIDDMAKKIRERPATAPLSTAESVPINDLIHERLKQLWDQEPYKLIECEFCPTLEGLHTVRASSEGLKQVLDIIIDNAVEAMDYAKLRKLSITIRMVDNNLEVVIRDTGRGIPRDILPTLLEEPIQHPPGSKGLGMGLLMARMIVQAYGGDIRIDTTGPEGTTMIVWLPVEDQKTTVEIAFGKAHFLLISSSHECSWLRVFEDALAPLGTLEIQTEREAIDRVVQEYCDIIIVDATSTDDFLQLIAQIRKRWLDAKIVVITASPTWKWAREAFRAGALDYISKSMSIQDLRSTFAHILGQL